MVKIYIPNHQPSSEISALVFDSKTQQFVSKQGVIFEKEAILKHRNDFQHPVLTTLGLPVHQPQVDIFFPNYESLFSQLDRIYPTIIHHDTPNELCFHIKPLEAFFDNCAREDVFISSHPHKSAKESIRIAQLNAIISRLQKHPFMYSNKIVMDTMVRVANLPESININEIYTPISALPIETPSMRRMVELRFISHKIGFGVFARQAIAKNQQVLFYLGNVHQDDAENSAYPYAFAFRDAFHCKVDAYRLGNIARFINHAPNEAQTPNQMIANLVVKEKRIHGLRIIALYALRDIQIGEQLLFCYHNHHNDAGTRYSFRNQYQLYDEAQYPVKPHHKDTAVYHILAENGVYSARMLLLRKPVGILLALLLILLLGSVDISF